jgi:hypothetical protein
LLVANAVDYCAYASRFDAPVVTFPTFEPRGSRWEYFDSREAMVNRVANLVQSAPEKNRHMAADAAKSNARAPLGAFLRTPRRLRGGAFTSVVGADFTRDKAAGVSTWTRGGELFRRSQVARHDIIEERIMSSRSIARMSLPYRWCLILPAVASTACAQVAAPDPATSAEPTVASLPVALMGTFSPYSRSYRQLGELIITADVLSWGRCQQVKYRVFRQRQGAYYIEQEAMPACKFVDRSTYLVLIPTNDGLELSICPERDEFDKPEDTRLCSWGVLYKKKV